MLFLICSVALVMKCRSYSRSTTEVILSNCLLVVSDFQCCYGYMQCRSHLRTTTEVMLSNCWIVVFDLQCCYGYMQCRSYLRSKIDVMLSNCWIVVSDLQCCHCYMQCRSYGLQHMLITAGMLSLVCRVAIAIGSRSTNLQRVMSSYCWLVVIDLQCCHCYMQSMSYGLQLMSS